MPLSLPSDHVIAGVEPVTCGLQPSHPPRQAMAMTLAECVPWLEIALEFIDRGPAGLTIEAVERYRSNLIEIIEHIRPVVAREAKLTH